MELSEAEQALHESVSFFNQYELYSEGDLHFVTHVESRSLLEVQFGQDKATVHVIVSDAFRGKGIGKGLVEIAKKSCHLLGLGDIEARMIPKESVGFYERLGFDVSQNDGGSWNAYLHIGEEGNNVRVAE